MSPRYRDIADDLRRRIDAGEWQPGDKLPIFTELAAEYHASRSVISEALSILESEGLITVVKRAGITVRERAGRRRIRRGTQVTRDVHHAVGGMSSGYNFPAAQGEAWQTHGKPRRSTEPAPERVAELLNLEPGTPTLRRRRVTSPEGEPPFQLVDTWIHPRGVDDAPQVGEPSTGPGGYLDRLEEAGHGPIEWEEYLRARMPTPEESRLVDMPAAMPVIEISRVGTSASTGEPIEVTVCVIPADRVEIVSTLRRAPSAKWPRDE